MEGFAKAPLWTTPRKEAFAPSSRFPLHINEAPNYESALSSRRTMLALPPQQNDFTLDASIPASIAGASRLDAGFIDWFQPYRTRP
jgi:hypothetical protein